jgi:hypothetical protein
MVWLVRLAFFYYALSQNYKKRPLAMLCLFVLMEQLSSHWTDFGKIWFLSSVESVKKIQVSLKFHKNDGHYTWGKLHIYESISLNTFKWKVFQIHF